MAQCTAKSKRSGEQCKRGAVPGGTKCHIHGGKSLVGAASPAFRTGRYSKHLPARLMARYQEAQSDPQLLALRDEVALVDARLADLLGRVDTGESARRWQEAQEAFEELRRAQRKGKDGAKEFIAALDDLEQALRSGNDYGLWAEIASVVDLRKRLVESERKRLVEMQQMITAERAMVLLSRVVDIIRTHVTDRDTLAAISADFRALAVVEPSK